MGWAVGFGTFPGRHIGYGVPAICDHPGCTVKIDRGLAYACGEEPSNYRGCGLFFCHDHLWLGSGDDDPQMCERCCNGEPPFEPKPDVTEWVLHVLLDETWQQWRDENPERVRAYQKQVPDWMNHAES